MSDVLTEGQEALAAYRAGQNPADMNGKQRSAAARALAAEGRTDESAAVLEPSAVAKRAPTPADLRVGMRAAHAADLRPAVAAEADLSGEDDPAEEDAADLLAESLQEILALLLDYVQFPSPEAAIAVTLWIAHAAARDTGADAQRDLIWYASPRLLLTSSLNGSGKSTLLDLIGLLLRSPDGKMVKVTPYGLATALGGDKSVGLPDDAQSIFGATGKANAELMNVMLGSYTRRGSWRNGKGGGTRLMIFGPVAYAGKDALIKKLAPQSPAIVDLLARSLIVRLGRATHYMPEMSERAEMRAEAIAAALDSAMGKLLVPLRTAAEALASAKIGQRITDGDGGRWAQIGRPLEAVAVVADTARPLADGARRPSWQAMWQASCHHLEAGTADLISARDALRSLRQGEGPAAASRSVWERSDLAAFAEAASR